MSLEVIEHGIGEKGFEVRVTKLLAKLQFIRRGKWRIMFSCIDGNHTLQVGHIRKDSYTGELEWGYGGIARINKEMNDSSIVQTVFGLFRAYEEHETREAFLFDGKRVFGPHMSIYALHDIADETDPPT